MTDISSHPLLQQAYDVCQAIEKCGASKQLTDAVCLASDLMRAIDAHLQAARRSLAAPKIEAVQGEAISFMLDPLEQAIESTARVLRDEQEHLAQVRVLLNGDVLPSLVYKRMSAHLEALLSAQLKRVNADEPS
jgi:hypothetical protein